MLHFWLAVTLLALSSLAHGATQPPPPPNPIPATTLASEFLEPHNKARAAVGVNPLKWSEKLAKGTDLLVRYQRNKMGCEFANLSNSKYGGNQLWASGQKLTPSLVVETWVGEKEFYNHSSNSCLGDHRCGVYTQVVWNKSLELGCAIANCVKEGSSLGICFYDPPGNVVGEKPY